MAERSERWVVNVFAVLGFGVTPLTLLCAMRLLWLTSF